MAFEPIFQPLAFRNLTVKNRIFRSNVSGRFDNYDGSGTQTRINWETKFAKGGVGAIISSFVPVHLRGRIGQLSRRQRGRERGDEDDQRNWTRRTHSSSLTLLPARRAPCPYISNRAPAAQRGVNQGTPSAVGSSRTVVTGCSLIASYS